MPQNRRLDGIIRKPLSICIRQSFYGRKIVDRNDLVFGMPFLESKLF